MNNGQGFGAKLNRNWNGFNTSGSIRLPQAGEGATRINITGQNLDRVRRMLRFFYKSFDRLLVLNSDQKTWLTGMDMNIEEKRIFQTAHWVNPCFCRKEVNKTKLFGITNETPLLLYTGRISKEKGVLELPSIYEQIRDVHKNIRIAIVGQGPELTELQERIPDGIFLDWVDQSELPAIYSSADVLLLPSKFDTFCNVVLEALSCGLPVIAYNKKGPKDIILNNKCGYLVNTPIEIGEKAIDFLSSTSKDAFREAAIKRAKEYDAQSIISELLNSVGIKG